MYHVLEFPNHEVIIVSTKRLINLGITDEGYWEHGDGYDTLTDAELVRQEVNDELDQHDQNVEGDHRNCWLDQPELHEGAS